jgi:hypothetical protein
VVIVAAPWHCWLLHIQLGVCISCNVTWITASALHLEVYKAAGTHFCCCSPQFHQTGPANSLFAMHTGISSPHRRS